MNSIHRRKLLKEVANKERNMESEVLAIIALDEIAELDIIKEQYLVKIEQLNAEIVLYGPRKSKGTVS